MPLKPKVSLITTVYNEAANVEEFMLSIYRQSQPPDEVVVVDAGSTDGTVARIEAVAARHGALPTSVVVSPGCNISQGRNIAIASAAHEVIAVSDAGTTLTENWLELLVDPFSEGSRVDVVGGHYRPVLKNQLQRAVYYGFCWTRKIDPEGFLPSSRSIAFRKEAWRSVGGYPEWLDYGEDTFFDLALKEQGFAFFFQENAVVLWEPRETLWQSMVQYYRYGRGDGNAFQLFDQGYSRFLGHFGQRLLLAAASFFYPPLLWLLALHILLFTLRYRVVRIFWNGEKRCEQLKAAAVSLLVSPLVEGAMVYGYLEGLSIRKKRQGLTIPGGCR